MINGDRRELQDSVSEFPADQLLRHLGSSVSSLMLLPSFDLEQASRYSSRQFAREGTENATQILFTRDRLTGDIVPRPAVRELCLSNLTSVHPNAAASLGERLLTDVIGEEISDAGYFASWMLRSRSNPLAQAAVASVAAYSPLELAVTLGEIEEAIKQTGRLEPYRRVAQVWLKAIASEPDKGSVERSMSVLRELSRLGVNDKAIDREARRSGSRSEFSSGYLPLVSTLAKNRSHAESGLLVASEPTGFASIRSNTEDERFIAELALSRSGRLSESTRKLLGLVIEERGANQVYETAMVQVSRRSVSRDASIGVVQSAVIGEARFAYLGSLPSSVADVRPFTAETIDGDRLVIGQGPEISAYVEEVTAALNNQMENSIDHGQPLSVSDWSRLSRSVREPWRFVSTYRIHGGLPHVRVAWREPIEVQHITALWPFGGTVGSVFSFAGFRYGDDDSYSVRVELDGAYESRTAQLTGVPRPSTVTTLDRPSRVANFAVWNRRAFLTLLALTIISSGLLLATGVAAATGELSGIQVSNASTGLSIVSTIAAGYAAYLSNINAKARPDTPTRRGIVGIFSRAASVAAASITLILVTLLFAGSDAVIGFGIANVSAAVILMGSIVTAALQRGKFARLSERRVRAGIKLLVEARTWSPLGVPADSSLAAVLTSAVRDFHRRV